MPEAPDDVVLSLQAKPVVQAMAKLDTLLAGERVEKLRELLVRWRAGAACQGDTRLYFRQIAEDFGVDLPRGVHGQTKKIISAIAATFIARVSATRFWCRGAGSGVSAADAVACCAPGTIEAMPSAAAARGSGAEEHVCSNVGERGLGVPGAAPDGASMRKAKQRERPVGWPGVKQRLVSA